MGDFSITEISWILDIPLTQKVCTFILVVSSLLVDAVLQGWVSVQELVLYWSRVIYAFTVFPRATQQV